MKANRLWGECRAIPLRNIQVTSTEISPNFARTFFYQSNTINLIQKRSIHIENIRFERFLWLSKQKMNNECYTYIIVENQVDIFDVSILRKNSFDIPFGGALAESKNADAAVCLRAFLFEIS